MLNFNQSKVRKPNTLHQTTQCPASPQECGTVAPPPSPSVWKSHPRNAKQQMKEVSVVANLFVAI